jgi:hypothetical protein
MLKKIKIGRNKKLKVKYDCIPCILRQAIEAARLVTDDEKVIDEIISNYSEMIPDIRESNPTPLVVSQIQKLIKDKTGNEDPYQKLKEKNIRMAMDIYEDLKDLIENDKDPLKKSLLLSATGNVIDAGISVKIKVEESILNTMEKGFSIDDYQSFKEKLKDSQTLLIIGDNAGEAVLDKLLLRELNNYNIDLAYAVREEPVLNDITLKESKLIGLDKYANVLSSGCTAPGMLINQATPEFLEIYNESDIVLSKGQGNLEGLSEEKRSIFFLLKAKCDLIAEFLDVELNDLVFKYMD